MSDVIMHDTPEIEELCHGLRNAAYLLDKLIAEHRPTIMREVYLTSEDICRIFSISVRALQNYRDHRQIPFTMIGGKILYPQGAVYKMLEKNFIKALR